jgi:hypothetical protein
MTGSDPRDESPRDRKRLARQVGLGRLSFISALAGVLVAYGAFAVLAALVGAVTVALGLDTELAHNDQATVGRSNAVVVTAVEVTTSGFNLNTVGIILMIAGALGLVLSLLFWSSFSPYRRSRTVAGPDTVVEERRIERDLP